MASDRSSTPGKCPPGMERSFQVHFRSDLVDVGDGDGGDDDDGDGGGRTFPAHPGPIPKTCRDQIGVRGFPYRIFDPWAPWGWGLDGLGDFFRRRCRHRRRHRRPDAPDTPDSIYLLILMNI